MNEVNLRVVQYENVQPISTVTGTDGAPTLVTVSFTVPPVSAQAQPVAAVVPVPAAVAGR